HLRDAAHEPVVHRGAPAAVVGIEPKAVVRSEKRQKKAVAELGVTSARAEDEVEELLGRGSGGSIREVLVNALAHAPARSEGEEPPRLRRRAGWLLARRDRAQLGGKPLELGALPLFELLELASAPLLERLERLRPPAVEAGERRLHAAHHAERRNEAPIAVRAVEDDAGAEVAERDRILAAAPEADDRDLPVVRVRDAEPARLDGGRRRRRGGSGRGRQRGFRIARRRRGFGALLPEARRCIVGDRLVRVQFAGALEERGLGLGSVRIRDAAVDRTHRGARLVIVEADALGALLRDDVE